MDSSETLFLAEKLMGLFWVLVQQTCFCGTKILYESLSRERARVRTILFFQCVIFLAFCAVSFERELGIPFLSSALWIGERDFYPWAVRVILCSGMVLFDALLALYIYRIFRLCYDGHTAFCPTFLWDTFVFLCVTAVCAGFINQSVSTTIAHDLDMDMEFTWIARSFLAFSNFFYVLFETCAAAVLFRAWFVINESNGKIKEGATNV
ncbi:hypothetical protein AGMMS49957_17640 [Synergistales bacterium]|nr:hypothetical protein AGMMS49957_17640 [Synergistales bacterium]